MNTLEWLLSFAGAGGALTAAAWLGLLPALVSAAMAFIRGVIAIVLDLAGCAAGRIALLMLAAALSAGYCFHWEYNRGRASCHSVVHPVAPPSGPDWRDVFGRN